MSTINFLHKETGNYGAVERSIFDPISDELSKRGYECTYEYSKNPKGLNFGLFFGRGSEVFMSHGVADKNYLFRKDDDVDLAINNLKALFVPGPWLKRKILAHPDVTLTQDKIYCVGWPRLDALLAAQKKYDAESKTLNGKLKVLWAPTHDARKHDKNQKSTSSYPEFESYVAKLNEEVDVVTSLHPRNRKNKKPTGNEFLDADVVIADFGTTVYEAWALGKPVIFPYWLVGEGVQKYRPGSAEAYIFEHKIGFHPNSFDEMLSLFQGKSLEVGNDVSSFMEDYLPSKFLGVSSKTCANQLISLSQCL